MSEIHNLYIIYKEIISYNSLIIHMMISLNLFLFFNIYLKYFLSSILLNNNFLHIVFVSLIIYNLNNYYQYKYLYKTKFNYI